MKLWTLALAFSVALAAGCDRKPLTPPSPKTDSSSAIPQAVAGSSTTPMERREGANPQQRDFQSRGDAAGPSTSDTQPTTKN